MGSHFYIILLAAVAPALVLGYHIYHRDKFSHEPAGQLVKGFIFGALTVLIAGPAEALLVAMGLAPSHPVTLFECVWDAFFGVALVEEGVKLIALCWLLRRNRHFDEMMDGVVYAAMVGLGFAAAENIGYLISNIDSWQSVALSRAIFAVPGHFMFAVTMGYYYSKQHFYNVSSWERAKVLVMPIMLHGTYDAILMYMDATPAASGVLFLVFLVFCIMMPKFARRKINKLLEDDEMQQKVKDLTLYL